MAFHAIVGDYLSHADAETRSQDYLRLDLKEARNSAGLRGCHKVWCCYKSMWVHHLRPCMRTSQKVACHTDSVPASRSCQRTSKYSSRQEAGGTQSLPFLIPLHLPCAVFLKVLIGGSCAECAGSPRRGQVPAHPPEQSSISIQGRKVSSFTAASATGRLQCRG